LAQKAVLSAFEIPFQMQQRNQYQSVENFLNDESFRKWVLEGQGNHEWEEWALENTQRAKLVEEAREWLLALHLPNETISLVDVQLALQHTWNKIRAIEDTSGKAKTHFRPLFWWRVTASVLLVSTLLGVIYRMQSDTLPEPQQKTHSMAEQTSALVEKKNITGHPLLIMLADGSSVLLQPNSTLRYPPVFEEKERKVYLSGDGFFEISKDSEKPFFVYANELVTKVVGTSFRIKAFSDQKNVEVVVRTGKVNVSAGNSDQEGLLLLPNQGVRLARQSLVFEKIEDLTKEKNHSQELSNIERLSFEFTDVPVSQIFKTIEQAYLVKIDFPAEKLANCYLTTSLSDQPLSEKLKIICESLGGRTTYAINENKITIHSSGCN
jgi:ferric-dicitrate binding protein FerR (iron transport regulator)